jgi:SAM-dependent methyltransferase
LITNFKLTGNILDIGCGTGEVLHFFNQKGWQTSGIEPAEKPRLFAQLNYGLMVYPEEHLDLFGAQSFDVITMWHVLEHVSNLNERIEQVKRLLKNDGILIIALPNVNSWDSGYYKEYWAAWDVPRHLYHFTQTSIRLLLSKHNLNLHETVPMKFDSYYVSLLSEKYKSGKTKLFRSTLNGFRSNINAKKNSNNYSSLIFLAKKLNP